jgi:NAD(P)-dependent dehydrogenase (short-subunit alcohol dehydrogenase family)
MINNAGIAKPQPFLEITRENWEAHLGIHLFGAFYCSQAAAREIAKRKYCHSPRDLLTHPHRVARADHARIVRSPGESVGTMFPDAKPNLGDDTALK